MTGFASVLLLLSLLVLYAYFSFTETALASVSRFRLKTAADAGKKAAATAEKLLGDYSRTLSSVLLGSNLAGIALTAVVTSMTLANRSRSLAPIVVPAVSAALLLFGDILPKILAAAYADKAALLTARPFAAIKAALWPFVTVFALIVDRATAKWTLKQPEPFATVEELAEIVEVIEDEGVFSENESELIKSAIEFTDIQAKDIMIPRVDLLAFDIEDGARTLLYDDRIMTFSRIPVFKDSIDNIIGILPAKSLMLAAIEAEGAESIDVGSLLTPAVFAHMTRPISSILGEFRRKRLQAAVVVDEYGGTMGMLTLEDIIEEIMGEIFDETDEVREDITRLHDGSFEAGGGVNISDFFDGIGYEPPDFESDYTTLGGWATEILDRFPQAGDSFRSGRLEVTVTKAQAMRVERLKAVLYDDPEE